MGARVRAHVARNTVAYVALIVAAIAAAGAAFAAIPGSGGVISSCYLTDPPHTLRVIDAASESCNRSETALSWNQQGAEGPAGPPGPPGPPGTGQGGGPAPVYAKTVAGPIDPHGQNVASLLVPGGDYAVIAKVGMSVTRDLPIQNAPLCIPGDPPAKCADQALAEAVAATHVRCKLFAGDQMLDAAAVSILTGLNVQLAAQTMSLAGPVELAGSAPQQLRLNCDQIEGPYPADIGNIRLVAIRADLTSGIFKVIVPKAGGKAGPLGKGLGKRLKVRH